MNIYLHELKARRKSMIIWSLSLAAIVIVFMNLYPAFTKDVAASRHTLASFPASLRAALDLSLANFFTVYGFYSYILTFILLAGAIQAMNLGTGLIAEEDAGKTADFLLSKPVSRGTVVTGKLMAALSVLLVTDIIFVATSLAVATAVVKGGFSAETMLLLALILSWVQLAFLAIGMFFSVSLSRIKSVIGVSLPVVFAFYIIGTLGAIIGNDKVRYVTPFKFFDTDYIIAHRSYELRFAVLEVALIIVAVSASYIIYGRKDIRSAT